MQVYHIQNNRHAHKQKSVLFTLKKHCYFFELVQKQKKASTLTFG